MRISTVIPVYNREDYICSAIDSVLNQIRKSDEIIVVDDASTDRTVEKVKDIYSDKVRIITLPVNVGNGGARSVGVQNARFDWIAFLDSDDSWSPRKNLIQCKYLEENNSNVIWLFGNTRINHDDGNSYDLFTKNKLDIDCYTIFRNPISVIYPNMFCVLGASLIHRPSLLKIGAFREGLRIGVDFLVAAQMINQGYFAATPDIVYQVTRNLDLSTEAVHYKYQNSEDFFISRMQAIESFYLAEHKDKWAKLYAGYARGYCQAGARNTIRNNFKTSFAQYKYKIDINSIFFSFCLLFGTRGLSLWKKLKAIL